MERVRSKDGTTVAFDRLGNGPTVIVVGGATCDRAMTRPLAEQLAQRFTLINYDRRGRGDSGDTAPYAVEREIEDLGALIAVAGAPRRCTAIPPARASPSTRRRTACPSPSSFCTSRSTCPTARRSGGPGGGASLGFSNEKEETRDRETFRWLGR